MKKFKFISLVLCFCIIISLFSPVYAMESNSEERDIKFEESLNFLTAFKMLGTTAQKKDVSLITRGEFAYWLLNILGIVEQKDDSSNNDSKYFGYTNEPEFDINGDWIWNSENGDVSEDSLTEFHDVSSTHPFYSQIQMISKSGYMSGSSGYFRPDEPITGFELIKVAVELTGAKELAQGVYPEGYYRQATNMKLTKDAKYVNEFPISYRDAVVILYATLNTNVWEHKLTGGNNWSIVRNTDVTVLENISGIKSIEGVVTKNNITGINSVSGISDKYIEIDDIAYYCDSLKYSDLLGYKVNAYYKNENGDNELMAVLPLMTNTKKTIYSDAEPKYEAPYLYYTDDSDRRKKVYVGAETNIIYNDVYISAYDSSIFDIVDSSNIVLLDNDSDNKYETVFVNQMQNIKVSAVDTDSKIIYDGLSSSGHIYLNNFDKIAIYDDKFNSMSLENIVKNSVISYQKTLATQKNSSIKIICSTEALKGTVKSINMSEQTVVVDDIEYKAIKGFDYSTLFLGGNYMFYLSYDKRLVEAKSEGTLQYAYLRHISYKRREDTYWAKIYDIESQEMQSIQLSERVKINRKRQKLNNSLFDNPYLFTPGNDDCDPQMIQDSKDEEGNVAEILTANFDNNLFSSVEINKPGNNAYYDNWLTYKSGGSFFGGTVPVGYTQTGTRFINIPLTDVDDEKGYFRISYGDNSMSGHNYPDYIFKANKDSAFVDLLVDFTDVSVSGEPDDSHGLLMAEKIVKMVKDDEICYFIKAFAPSGNEEFYVYDTDLFPVAEQIARGDLFRCDTGGKRNEVVKLKKIFDAKTKMMTSTQSPYGSNFTNAQLYYFHGFIDDITDNGMMVWAKPYTYELSGSDIVYSFKGNEASHIINVSKCSVYVYDGIEAYRGSYETDIFSKKLTAKGSQVVAYSSYGTPKSIFIFK